MTHAHSRLLYSLLCEGVIVGYDGKAAVFGTFTNINATSFPVVFPKFTVFNGWIGPKGTFAQTTKIMSSQGTVLAEAHANLEIREDNSTANVIHDFRGVSFATEGAYWVRVFLGDAQITEYPLTVRRQPQPEKSALA